MSSVDRPVHVRGLRATLSASPLLGFDSAKWGETGKAAAKAAFVGQSTRYEVVTTLDDNVNSPTQGSLRYYLNNEVAGDVITFDPGLAHGTINLNGTLTISKGVTIDGGNTINISGQNKYGVFKVSNGNAPATVENLTIENGNSTSSSSPPGFGDQGKAAGGGIYLSSGSLVLANDTFLNNHATGGNGSNAGMTGLSSSDNPAANGGDAAGAVYVTPGTTVSASKLVFTNNTATAGKGGTADGANPTPGTDGTAYPDSNSATVRDAGNACFATGTMIATARGNVAVEHLAVGDRVVTSSGENRSILWIGHRTVDCRRHPRPEEAYPIRIAAHAFAENRPVRDLYVSPGHAICIDMLGELLIPAGALVNGATIQQVEVDEVTYWHVELESHDIILAEDLPAESYLDMGNRSFFDEADVVALDASPDADLPAQRTSLDFCRPFHTDGAILDAVRLQLRRRAAAMGWIIASTPLADLHLLVDGMRIEPKVRGLSACFAVPAGASDVWLVSDASRPCDVSDIADSRRLGVCLGGLAISDGFDPREIDLGDALLATGFHGVEEGSWRWTNGRALLPAALWEDCQDAFFLRIDIAGPVVARWTRSTAAMGLAATGLAEAA